MKLYSSIRSTLSSIGTVFAIGLCACPGIGHAAPGEPRSAQASVIAADAPRIQLALLLDTSSSMDGLIHQAREQLWSVVNTLADARNQGRPPVLEVALYEYGNSGLREDTGWIRQVLGFTRDLDSVSEALFGLRTNGGDEYCGQVISTALRELQWSSGDQVLKIVYIAGNEPFTQGPVDYREAIAEAKRRGVRVNTIHCGASGSDPTWQQGAQLAGGDFFNIDDQQQVAHIPAPQDTEISKLNGALNQTYVPFGSKGSAGQQRQAAQDANAAASAPALLSKRARAKASSLYTQAEWDLVDAYREDPKVLEQVQASDLPEEMQTLDAGQREQYVQTKREEREQIRTRLDELMRERESFVEAKRKEAADESVDQSLGAALRTSIEQAAREKNFEIPERPSAPAPSPETSPEP